MELGQFCLSIKLQNGGVSCFLQSILWCLFIWLHSQAALYCMLCKHFDLHPKFCLKDMFLLMTEMVLVVTKFFTYCKTLVFGGHLVLAILAVKAKNAKIKVRRYYMQSKGSDKMENLMNT